MLTAKKGKKQSIRDRLIAARLRFISLGSLICLYLLLDIFQQLSVLHLVEHCGFLLFINVSTSFAQTFEKNEMEKKDAFVSLSYHCCSFTEEEKIILS